MRETNGDFIGSGEGDYQSRHAAPQLGVGLMEALANAADQYRYGQLQQQYDAELAIIRTRLFTDKESAEDQAFIESQRQKVAESIGKQAAAKAYADGLRAQLYYAPSDGVYYHGRHRQEDRPIPEEPQPHPEGRHAKEDLSEPLQAMPPEAVLWNPPEPVREEFSKEVSWASPAPEPPISEPEPPPEKLAASDQEPAAPEEGSGLSDIAGVDEVRPAVPPEPPPEEPPAEDIPPAFVPPQPEKKGVLHRLRHAWYAGVAATTVYFSNPEKGRRRRVVTAMAVVLGVAAAGGVAGWLHGHWQDWFHHPGQQPPQAVGPSPNSEQFFDTIKPFDYHGEPYEWTAAAHQNGSAQATPHLLRAIDYARGDGLRVDTWGSPAQGQWGINSVTVRLPDGTYKSYYDTPRKLAILQWYAGGMGPKG